MLGAGRSHLDKLVVTGGAHQPEATELPAEKKAAAHPRAILT
jgi:hypothetical protein